uniref:Uncharacterized protein n=1 Tax=Engystomops pustulosus TaxID=76066 RepID=A0AAV6YVZ4_ENGPU|nr:hypothetical protein GDO81_030073 [Engystomops pustulosus]
MMICSIGLRRAGGHWAPLSLQLVRKAEIQRLAVCVVGLQDAALNTGKETITSSKVLCVAAALSVPLTGSR